MGEQISELRWKQRTEYDDRRIDSGLPECNPLVDREDGHTRETLANQCLGCFNISVPVGIGFHDRHHVAARAQDAAKLRHIIGKGVQVDGGAGREEC